MFKTEPFINLQDNNLLTFVEKFKPNKYFNFKYFHFFFFTKNWIYIDKLTLYIIICH